MNHCILSELKNHLDKVNEKKHICLAEIRKQAAPWENRRRDMSGESNFDEDVFLRRSSVGELDNRFTA